MTLATRVPTEGGQPARPAAAPRSDVLLGEDWVAPEGSTDPALRAGRQSRGFLALNRSPLARKIVVFNLLALIILVAGVLFLNPFRDSLVQQRERALVLEARLIAEVFRARLPAGGSLDGLDAAAVLETLDTAPRTERVVFAPDGTRVASIVGDAQSALPLLDGAEPPRQTVITDLLNALWEGIQSIVAPQPETDAAADGEARMAALLSAAAAGETSVRTGQDTQGNTVFSVATPIRDGDRLVGIVAVTSATGEIDRLVRDEREQVLQMFVIALLVSIGLSLVLASTIANPLSDLAAAAELGRDRNARKMAPGRIRIPDLTARPDEIGRLSIALRGMVTALYDRIDANEQFASDVAHEIKNPLASLRSAVGTMRHARRDDQREKLLDVIEHDVRRLDRLVSDISNASRLDSELVKEESEEFNLLRTISNLSEYLGQQASEKGVDFITDLPSDPIVINGLEARLAQVFVNLITNAISFCEEGDAVRVWARRRDNRVLVVVEDTGPGIPEQALTKIFKRFYSERPPGQFGNHSGLGLAISKQIVEAHGGVIWAENIRPSDEDATSEPLGARFVVGLPI
jgi:two-component system sensor histidine kinase ChvG